MYYIVHRKELYGCQTIIISGDPDRDGRMVCLVLLKLVAYRLRSGPTGGKLIEYIVTELAGTAPERYKCPEVAYKAEG
jgi:hypothetical protein